MTTPTEQNILKEKKIVIDLNAEEMIHFEGRLGVSDCLQLLECLNEITGNINKHLEKVTMASYISLAGKVKMECELNDNEDGETRISNEKFANFVEEVMK
jgi:hypothetical protein